MQDRPNQSGLKISWEHIDDPKADELLRQIAKLILDDLQELSTEISVDKNSPRALNEGVPVEEHKQITTQE